MYLKAILDFPTQKSVTDIHSWFGLLNQVSDAFSTATCMHPFLDLLKPVTKFSFNNATNDLFEESKLVTIRAIKESACIFNLSKPACLANDWTKTDVDLWLFQKPQGRHSIVKNTGGWLDSLGSGILVGKDVLGFFKNIDLDNS